MSVPIFIGVIAIFALRGYFLGFIGIIVQMLSLSAAFFIAVTYHPWMVSQLEPWISPSLMLSSMIIKGAAVTLLFFGALIGARLSVAIVSRMLRLLVGEKLSKSLSSTNKSLGILLNAGVGACFAMLIVWVVMMAMGRYSPESIRDDEFGLSIANTMNEFSLQIALPALEKMGIELPDNTGDAFNINNLIDLPEDQDGNPSDNTSSQYRMVDETSQASSVDQNKKNDGKEFDHAALAQRIAAAESSWQKNSVVKRMLEDPEIRQFLNKGDISGLLASERFQSLVQNIDPASLIRLTDLLFMDNPNTTREPSASKAINR